MARPGEKITGDMIEAHVVSAERSLRQALDLCVRAKRSSSGGARDLKVLRRRIGSALDAISGARQRSFRPLMDEPGERRERPEKETQEVPQQPEADGQEIDIGNAT